MSTNGRKSRDKAKEEPESSSADQHRAVPVTGEKPKTARKKPKPIRRVSKSGILTSVPEADKAEQFGKTEQPAAIQGPAATDNSTTTTMEVHHHPRLEHKPKPFKEYLLEGLMIFIAVMMGFIAENIRENIDNREHARQLTWQLVQDLKADIINLKDIRLQETKILKDNDSLFVLLQQPLEKVDTKKLQKLAANSHSIWPFHPSLGAIGAIKNELHLKQFASSKIISYIAKYEEHIDLLHTVQDITLQYQRNFLDPFLCAHFTPANLHAAFDDPAAASAQMRNLKQEDLTQLAAQLVLVRINNNELLTDNERLRNDAENLLKYVNEQFHPGE